MIWILVVLVVLVWFVIVKYSIKKRPGILTSSVAQLCPAPDCVRCSKLFRQSYRRDVDLRLRKMYGTYDSVVVHKLEERLTFDVSTLPASRQPTVCYLRNICSDAWHTHKQKYLQDTLCDSYSTIKIELVGALCNENLWSLSQNTAGSSGIWRKLFLYNQGKKVDVNCRELPKTTSVIENLDSFMGGVIFGNAFISILDAGGSIEPHCGPTNLRVRCHMGLQVPSGECSITVDDQEESWNLQECLLFDDSFLHSATNQSDSQRIVLIVDLWHPNLTLTEIKILSELFAVRKD